MSTNSMNTSKDTMNASTIICQNGADLNRLIYDAQSRGLRVEQKYHQILPNSFELIAESNNRIYNRFLADYAHDPTITIFYDKNHRKCVQNPFKIRALNNETSICDEPPTYRSYVDGVPDDITPTTMKSYYHVPDYDPETTPRPKIAIISLGGYYQLSDLIYYWDNVCHMTLGGTRPHVYDHVVGGHIMDKFSRNIMCLENTLDIELAGGFCPNADIHMFFADNTYLGYLQAFEDAISYGVNIISTSWGQSEETFYGGGGLQAYETVFTYAVTHNICITAASGDYGSSDNNYTTMVVPQYPIKVPVPHCDFPSTSPHVTACGGTSLYRDLYNEESAWIFGGGGQSSLFARPAYQGPWNPSWPVSPLAYGGTQHPNARTVPDVAFNADPNSPWHIYFSGYDDEGAGTSACSPIMAGILGVYYASSAPDAAPRNGYFGEGFNYYLYRSPTNTIKLIKHGYNITVDRQPITNEINPYGLYQGEDNTYYAVFNPVYSFCTGRGIVNSTNLLKYLNTVVCVARGTRILMGNNTYKPIELIQRGEWVIGYNHTKYRVAVVNRQLVAGSALLTLLEFSSNSLGNNLPLNKLLITPNHPLLIQGGRRPAKCFKMLSGVITHTQIKPSQLLTEEPDEHGIYYLYDLQFEDDGSYIAEGVPIQSRSPWSDITPLPKELYFDQTKFCHIQHWDSLHHTLSLDYTNVVP